MKMRQTPVRFLADGLCVMIPVYCDPYQNFQIFPCRLYELLAVT